MSQLKPLGFVEIRRRRGRIAGYSAPKVPCEVLWCGTNRPNKKFGERKNGWSFPPAVEELMLKECHGKTVLHLFGGLARFGYRLDLDPEVKPDKVGDAYIAHHYFERNSFDDVILDPPYMAMRKQEVMNLMDVAGWIARRYIWWFHTVEIATDRSKPLEHQWMCRIGHQCAVRVLQRFKVIGKRRPPEPGDFKRGPGLKYNRWANVERGLFPEIQMDNFAPAPNARGGQIPSDRVYLGDWQ